jgi:hypothetical protein
MENQTTEKKVKRDTAPLYQKAESLGLTLVRMQTRTEKTAWFIFASKTVNLGKPESQVVARLATPREVELYLMAYEAAMAFLTAPAEPVEV